MAIVYDKKAYPSGTILIRTFEDHVEIDDIIQSWKFLLVNNMLSNDVIGVINNISSCDLKMDIDGFYQVVAYLQTEDAFKRIRLAVICEDPKKIVFPTLGELIHDLKIKPFSTYQAAVDWILQN